MDALSDILRAVNLQGAVFFHARFTAPWRFESPHASTLAQALDPKAGHLILYHYVSEGECTMLFEGLPPIRLKAGDVILIPHGDAHTMASSASAPTSARMDVQTILRQRPHVLEHGGGGAAGRLICGYLACDPRLLRPVLDALPRAVTVSLRQDGESHWLERSILDAVDEASSPKPGGDTVLAKLSEVMVVETLRRYIEQLRADQPSWLGGLRDRMVGRCLALMHERPAHPWTVDSLAKAVGVSRSGLAERFTHFVGQPPMQYLGKWRMALAANYLSSTSLSLTRIAEEIGYDTTPAFNRAFRREHGMPPATWRRDQARAAPPSAALPGNTAPG
jgi:AraC-like DNA-binding protein